MSDDIRRVKIGNHTYEGTGGPCTTEFYGATCEAARDDHEMASESVCGACNGVGGGNASMDPDSVWIECSTCDGTGRKCTCDPAPTEACPAHDVDGRRESAAWGQVREHEPPPTIRRAEWLEALWNADLETGSEDFGEPSDYIKHIANVARAKADVELQRQNEGLQQTIMAWRLRAGEAERGIARLNAVLDDMEDGALYPTGKSWAEDIRNALEGNQS